ncbi:hypothetical protein [Chryseobacterium sp.]|uniref:hypothetical protein n=1 Tax=Chryseobacterium sp. TaxID=1871047 RepID=UPI002FC6732D
MKKNIIFYIILINYIISILVVIKNICHLSYPVINSYAILNTKKYMVKQTFFIEGIVIENSTRNRTSKTIILKGKVNNIKEQMNTTNESYKKYNGVIPILKNKLNDDLLINDSQNRNSYAFDNFLKLYFYLSFLSISIFTIFKLIKK